ncbi:MAG: hypothetical protein ACFFG0_39090 [Candidatus Thorarchaeota archaeon]
MNIEEIRENPDKIDWNKFSYNEALSEEFIREFKDKVYWNYISKYQKLSEEFIREFQDKVYWTCISAYQKLSEEFIREFKDKVYWTRISIHHKLSEDFIREFKDEVNWNYISIYQKLSEEFIREFKYYVNWYDISRYQKLSLKFRKEFNIKIPGTCWLYKSKKWKEKYIRENTNYKIKDGKVIAYKSCRSDGYSCYNFQYKYEEGKEYESHADYNANIDNSFGLSAWTKEGALGYYSRGKLFKVLIDIDDIACVVQNGKKIRARKIKILEEIPL